MYEKAFFVFVGYNAIIGLFILLFFMYWGK